MIAYSPRWSPDGKQIAFQGGVWGKPWVMYVISAEGGSPEQIATGLGDVGWTADGKSLIYSETPSLLQEGSADKVAIHLMDLATRQVSTLPDSKGFYFPRVSPNGRYIAAIRSGPESLLVLNRSARKWVELTTLHVNFPSWSHDSNYLYFDTWEGDALYRVRISDKKLERLASLKGMRRAFLVFSWCGLAPDDSFLVLRDTGTQEIYALDWEAP
jgi:Tol biopolymer transport system component